MPPDGPAGPAGETARLEALVRGRVQGVGYRYFVQRRAVALGIAGWVANEAGSTVRCVAEGPVPALRQLLVDLADGPAGASVETVDPIWTAPSGAFTSFEVRAGYHGGD